MYLLLLNFVSGCCAIFCMTGFSYILARITGENFREPELLNILLPSTKIGGYTNRRHWKGWIIHFIIGFAFASTFNALWSFDLFSASWSNAGVFGLCAGILSVGCWYIFIKWSSVEPPVILKGFYVQLVLAHIIFSLVTLAIYKLWILD